MNVKGTTVVIVTKGSTPGPVTTWMGDCLLTGKPSRYVPSHLGQLSLLCLRGGQIKDRPIWLGLWR